jgi:hypothetical protein
MRGRGSGAKRSAATLASGTLDRGVRHQLSLRPFCTTCISDQLIGPDQHSTSLIAAGQRRFLASGPPVAAPGYYEYEPKQP